MVNDDGRRPEVMISARPFHGIGVAFSGSADSGQRKVVKLFELETRETTELSLGLR